MQKELVKIFKKMGEYHDLYVQRDRLLLADVFECFRNMCINICKLNLAKCQLALKKTKVKLDLLTVINVITS